MSALRRRLNRVLLVLLGGLALQWFVADRTIVAVVEGEMESRLRHDADSLLASLELDANGQVHCDPRSPGTIYARTPATTGAPGGRCADRRDIRSA